MTTLVELEQKAQNFLTQGDMEKTMQVCHEILKENPRHDHALDALSQYEMAQGNFSEAEKHFSVLSESYPENAIFMTKLGYVQEKQNMLDQALATYLACYALYPENAVILLYIGHLHFLKEDKNKAAEIFSLAEEIDENILNAHLNPQMGEIISHRSRIARQVMHEILTDLHLETIQKIDRGGDLKRISDAVWPQIDVRNFEYAQETQKPFLFYIPDLQAVPYFKREKLSWARAIESNFDEIKQEVMENLDIEGDGHPYLDPEMPLVGEEWDKIKGKMAWGSVHLYKQGQPNAEVIAKFPKLNKILSKVPLCILGGNPSEIFISILQPETKIPPHFGVANSVLTVHFPLVVPEGCSLRVEDHVLMQKEGEILAFDDSYDHEAGNPGKAARIVLIFEVWHPDLAEIEQKAIAATFASRTKWLDGRSVK